MNMVRRRAGGRPTRDEAEALTRRLLDSARSAFARNGIANASMEEISADLGISKHTLYRRYQNKQMLLEAVVERDLIRFRKALAETARRGENPLAALHNIAFSYFLFGTDREYSAFYLSVITEAVISKQLGERLAAWSRAALEPIVETIVLAQAAGLLVRGDAVEMCNVLVDLLEGANSRVRLSLSERPDAAECHRLFESRWAIFQAAMKAGPLERRKTV
ncbi:TetR family transcriptional regulator [Sinorhizobium medicae]|nr:TetR family transcriptional regulator [Sinorhizobium medicae]MDX0578462.1 TetR family transcriptional regulator [Sinorhizobium medicae]MDX0782203.1 TetR family transcriptional regulator [Sinorhizobium medicae]